MAKENNSVLPIVAIVVIVAIVGLVMMFMNKGTAYTTTESEVQKATLISVSGDENLGEEAPPPAQTIALILMEERTIIFKVFA